MTEKDFPRFSAAMAGAMAFYKQNLSEFALQVWWETCKSAEFEQVTRALSSHLQDPERGQFAPKPADMTRLLHGTTTDRSAIAWGKAIEAASRIGAYTDVVFDDPAIHAVIEDLGGWPKFCRTEEKNLSYVQHAFQNSHKAYTARGCDDYPAKLVGCQSPPEVFAMRGLEPPRPILVGDQTKASAVLLAGRGGKASGPLALGRSLGVAFGGRKGGEA